MLLKNSPICAWYIRLGMDRRSSYFAEFQIGTLSPAFSFLGFLICFPWFTQDIFISEVFSAIVSLHNVSSDFDLRTLIQWTPYLPCISHIALSFPNIWIAWEGHSPMSSSVDKTSVTLIIIITWLCHVRGWMATTKACDLTPPPPVFRTSYTFQLVQWFPFSDGTRQRYEQDWILN